MGWVSGGYIKVLFLCKCKNKIKSALFPLQRITMGCLGCRQSVWGSIVQTNGCLRGLCVSDLTFDNSHWSVMEKIPMVYACAIVPLLPCPPPQHRHSHPFIHIYLFILQEGIKVLLHNLQATFGRNAIAPVHYRRSLWLMARGRTRGRSLSGC